MNTILCKYIITIAEKGSYTLAAEELFISQPALSQAIKRFENETGVKIFERISGKVHPTSIGIEVLNICKKMIELEVEMQNVISHYKNTNVINISIAPYYYKKLLFPLNVEFQKANPNIVINVSENFTDETIRLLLEDIVDIGFVNLPVGSVVGYQVKVFDEEVFLAVPIDYYVPLVGIDKTGDFESIDFAFCDSKRFIGFREGRRLDHILKELCDINFCKPNVIMRMDSVENIANLISSGVGVGILPGIFVYNNLNRDDIRYFRIKGNKVKRTFAFVAKNKEIESIAMKNYIEFILKNFKKCYNY